MNKSRSNHRKKRRQKRNLAKEMPSGKQSVRCLDAAPKSTNKTTRVLEGYVVAEEGRFKTPGRGRFTRESLSKIVEVANGREAGLRSRWTHPGLSSDGLGTFLGRSKNFRLDESGDNWKVRADLNFADVAFDPPVDGGGTSYGEYIMNLASEDPGALSSSLVIEEEQFGESRDGKLEPWDNGRHRGQTPIWMPLELHASDIVDTGDAVDELLSDDAPDSAVRKGYALLDSVFAEGTREVAEVRLNSFLKKYLDHSFGSEVPDTPEEEDTNMSDSISRDELLAALKENNEELSKSILGAVNTRLDEEKEAREKIRQEDLAKETRAKEIREISSLCAKMGRDSDVDGFLKEELSIGDVRKKLLDDVLANGGNLKTGGKTNIENLEGDAKFLAEYKELEMEDSGFSTDDYIDMRREEEGMPAREKAVS